MKKAFTIVELLIVIVMIGILAAFSLTTFANVSQKATLASMQSDLINATKKIKLYYAEKGSYPESLLCPVSLDTQICLNASPGVSFNYVPNNGSYPSFSIVASSSAGSYVASDSLSPTAVPDFITSGLALNLDVSNSSSYSGSGTSWTDLSGNNNNASLANSPTFNSSVPKNLYFNSTSNQSARVTSLENANFPTNSTISFWLKLPRQSTDLRPVFDDYRSDSKHIFIRTRAFTDLQVALQSSSPSYHYSYIVPNYNTAQWFNLTITIDVSNLLVKVYLNGSLLNSGVINDATWTPNGQYVGLMTSSTGNFATGSVGAFHIYNRVLSASEIAQNFLVLRGKYGL